MDDFRGLQEGRRHSPSVVADFGLESGVEFSSELVACASFLMMPAPTPLAAMSKVSVEDGRKRVKRGLRCPQSEWDGLLKDQHEGYISWTVFERTSL
jgi:hypothetical protein